MLGWVLAGNLLESRCVQNNTNTCHYVVTNMQLHSQVEKLWELDQISSSKGAKDLDPQNVCEQHLSQ